MSTKNSKKKEKKFLKNLLLKGFVIVLLSLTSGCLVLKNLQSTAKPVIVDWGEKGKIPTTVWPEYDWIITAKDCYPECEVQK